MLSDRSHNDYEDFAKKAAEFRRSLDEDRYDSALHLKDSLDGINADFAGLVTATGDMIDSYLWICVDKPLISPNSLLKGAPPLLSQVLKENACGGVFEIWLDGPIRALETRTEERVSGN